MRQSQLFTKTTKENPKGETTINAKLLIRAGFIDKVMAGVYTFLPLGLKVLRKIEQVVREEINAIGGQEILMPALSPKENWKKTDRWEGFDALFKLKGPGDKEYGLNPTHEEIVTPLLKKFIFSYKDLPQAVYQIQTKFRNEPRSQAGLLRGREFRMKDLYSFHRNEQDFEEYYEKVAQAYQEIWNRLEIGKDTFKTYATGGSFSKYSHEFQTLHEVGEDTIYLCSKCKIAVNKEIIEEQQHKCPECGNEKLEEKRAIEVGNIFPLKTKFSNAFELKYADETGKEQEIIMGCYGLGPSRVMGTIVEKFNDEKGIIWPKNIAPFDIHLLDFTQNKKGDKIYKILKNQGFDVLLDDRNESAGAKLNDADLIGIPIRLVISEKTGDQIEIKKRDEDDIQLIDVDKIIQNV